MVRGGHWLREFEVFDLYHRFEMLLARRASLTAAGNPCFRGVDGSSLLVGSGDMKLLVTGCMVDLTASADRFTSNCKVVVQVLRPKPLNYRIAYPTLRPGEPKRSALEERIQ